MANDANFLHAAHEDVGAGRVGMPSAKYSRLTDKPVAVTEQDLSEYRDNVRFILGDVTGGRTTARTFDNNSDAYAAIVVGEMLIRARRSVRCFSQQLSKTVYNLDSMRSALARSRELTIKLVVEEQDVLTNPESALCGAFDFAQNPRVDLQVYRPPFDVEHVLIVDGRMARIETERENRKASVQVARETSRFIQGASALFDQVHRLSTPLTI